MKRMILTAGLGVLLTGCGHPEPADGSPTDGSPTPTTGTTPASCALGGGDGALWLVSYGPLRVHRIDLATCALETLAVDLGSQDLRGLELGAGALYLAGTDNIVRIDVASGDETARVDVNGSSLAFGDGRLFSSGSDRFLDERDLDTLDVVRSASDPRVHVGPDGPPELRRRPRLRREHLGRRRAARRSAGRRGGLPRRRGAVDERGQLLWGPTTRRSADKTPTPSTFRARSSSASTARRSTEPRSTSRRRFPTRASTPT
jgi:hypothetical protein